ncbi:MAG: proton-conducting transporter transmembrane domain-containing protein [Candidatus Dormibacteria bacterium]
MHFLDAAWALLLLPPAGVAFSYLAETRRGSAQTLLGTAWLTLLAALAVLGATVARYPAIHQSTITFWTFSVTQSPFNAASRTLLAPHFQVGVGYASTTVAAALAATVALVVVLGQTQLMIQLRSDPRLASLMRLTSLVSFAAVALVMAPGLFQVVLGFELSGLFAALLIGSATGHGAGAAARRTYLVWRLGGLSLLLAVAFIYVKFSGPIQVAATAAAHHGVSVIPNGLNLAALSAIWTAAAHGQVPGVGGRTMTMAAALILLAVAAAAGQLPLHGVWRGLGDAPAATAATLVSVVGLAVAVSLLSQTYPLLNLAAGVLPALAVLASVSSVVLALLALRETRLRRFAGFTAGSMAGVALVGFGLGTPAGAVALALAALLGSSALAAVVTHLSRDLHVDSVHKLGPAWRQARPTVSLLMLALAACGGLVGAGTFFGRAAVLGAAFGGVGVGVRAASPWLRMIGGGGELLASGILAAACARVALAAIRGGDPTDPREARATRRHLGQTRGRGQLRVLRVGVALALISGLVSLPAVHLGLGPLLAPQRGTTALPFEAWAVLLTLLVPLVGAGTMLMLPVEAPQGASARPDWDAIGDGTQLIGVGEQLLLGWPARAVELFTARVWDPLSDAAGASFATVLELAEGERSWWPGWSARSGAATLAVLALAVAVVAWVGVAHPGAVGLP